MSAAVGVFTPWNMANVTCGAFFWVFNAYWNTTALLQDKSHNLGSSEQNENAGPLVKNVRFQDGDNRALTQEEVLLWNCPNSSPTRNDSVSVSMGELQESRALVCHTQYPQSLTPVHAQYYLFSEWLDDAPWGEALSSLGKGQPLFWSVPHVWARKAGWCTGSHCPWQTLL